MADLPTQRDFDDFAAWTGRDVLAPDGERLGAVELIYLDEATGVPEWVLVSLDDGSAFVPLAGASVEERAIRVDQHARPDRRRPAARAGGDPQRRRRAPPLRALRPRLLAGGVPQRAAGGRRRASEERPRLRKYVGGAPVPAPAAEETPRRRARGDGAPTGPHPLRPPPAARRA